MSDLLKGSVHCFGDDINTDVIIPARYLNKFDDLTLASHCMEDIDADFHNRVKPGDIIVAGKNFGCGSSREHAPLALKAAGISCVIAESFARIFFRNCINIGLPIIELKNTEKKFHPDDVVLVSLDDGKITNETTAEVFDIPPYGEFIQNIIKKGGLFNTL